MVAAGTEATHCFRAGKLKGRFITACPEWFVDIAFSNFAFSFPPIPIKISGGHVRCPHNVGCYESFPVRPLAMLRYVKASSPCLALGKQILLPAMESRKNSVAADSGVEPASRLSLRTSGRMRGPEERAEAPL